MATGLGIDVGSESIKVVQVRVSGSTVTVTGALRLPRTEQTLDAPPDNSGGSLIPERLGEELKRAGLRRTGTIGISGREIGLKYLPLAPMPPEKLKMVIDMEIGGKLTAKSAAAETPALTYDYRLLNLPLGLKGDLIVMAAMCKNEFLYGVVSSLKKANVGAETITPSCFGLVNAYLRTQKIPEKETVVLLDIGHELLEIAILEENRLYFARSAPGAGKKFTTGLDKVLKVGAAKATEFKHGRARIHPEGAPISNKQELAFQQALKEGADNIAGAIRSSIMFCKTQAKLPKLDYHRIIISGGGARLTGLKDYLEKKCGKPVQIMDLSSGLDLRRLDAASARCFEGEVPDMTVALGLAVVDADRSCFHFSLLPEAVVRRRMFWRKSVFAMAAGVILMAGLYWPIQSSAKAVVDAEERQKLMETKRDEAKKERQDFVKLVEQNKATMQKADYYGRQTRLGRVYLDLFAKLRSEAPLDVKLSYFGPPMEGESGRTGIGFGTWMSTDEPVRKFIARGYYDAEAYPGSKFEDAWKILRERLLEVPGVADAEHDLSEPETGGTPGTKQFQLNISLKDPAQPIVPKAAAPGLAPDKAELPKGSSGQPEKKQ